MKKKKFSYTRWACSVASQCLYNDIECGFEVANTTPNREKAIKAMEKLIEQLRRRGE